MNGIEKKQLQIDRGTREIVQMIDELRLKYGFDNVQVLTPIVETRLRAGLIPQRPLVLSSPISESQMRLQVTVPMGYPRVRPSFQVLETSGGSVMDSFTPYLEYLPESSVQVLMDMIFQEINSKVQSTEVKIQNETEEKGSSLILDDSDEGIENESEFIFYCCRSCRCCLADSSQLHEHSKSSNSNNCTSVFLEDPPSFFSANGVEEGKLLCPKCQSKVGTWSWVGNKCSCGEWIVPAYQFPKSKVDTKSYS
jgi:dual specificity phosphatase 12